MLFSSHVLEEVAARLRPRPDPAPRPARPRAGRCRRLEEGRLVHVRFAGAVVDPPAAAGPAACAAAHGDALTLEYTGPLRRLLGWLAGQPLAELRMEPLGLGAVYYRFHGDAA